jgi:hypothetical protein
MYPVCTLQEITDRYIGDTVERQICEVAALAGKFHHSIEVAREAKPDQPGTFRYNCYMYALELEDRPGPVVRIARRFAHVYPNADFMAYLMAGPLTELGVGDLRDEDIVVYLSHGQAKHTGKLRGGFVVSKWGTAHLWRHRLFEVPFSYGDEVRFFKRLPREEVSAHFVAYAERVLGKDAVDGF